MAPGNDFGTSLLALRRRLRDVLTTAFAPLLNWLSARGVDPDHVTWAGFALALAAAIFAGFDVFVLAGILYLASGAADLLDGALARRASRSSRAGAFLDSVLDRGGEAALHAGAAVAFAYWGVWPAVLAVALSLAGSFLTSYARARAEALGIELQEAWVSRGERVVFIALALIFHFAIAGFWILAAVSWATAVQRSWIACKRLRDLPAGEDGHRETPSPEDPTND